jgi:hypothetical protein
VKTPERELGDGVHLLFQAVCRDPRCRVARLDDLRVGDVGVLVERPFQQAQIRSLCVGERTLADDVRLRERASAKLPERSVGTLAGARDDDHLRAGHLQHRGAHRDVDLFVGMRVHLVDDRQRRFQPVQQPCFGGERAQVPGEDPRLPGIRTPTELEMAVDNVWVIKEAGEAGGRLEQDPRLFATRGGAVDRGAVDSQKMVKGDRREQVGLAVSSGEEEDGFPRAADRPHDLTLKRLQIESDRAAELQELHKQTLSDDEDTLHSCLWEFSGERPKTERSPTAGRCGPTTGGRLSSPPHPTTPSGSRTCGRASES